MVLFPHTAVTKNYSLTPKTQIIYDATVRFCDRFIDRKSRTHDQMVQAARSGNKNIAEGSRISGTSKEAELKLTNVARANRNDKSTSEVIMCLINRFPSVDAASRFVYRTLF